MRIYRQYINTLKQQCGYQVSYQRTDGLFSPNIFPVVFKSHEARQAAEEMMTSRLIETRRWYQPLIQNHPDLKGIEKIGPTPISDGLEMRMLGLPFYIDMSLEEQTSIAKTIKNSF
jgi:dTDP-4-amino-4,6-dideoxygalactose transaminase